MTGLWDRHVIERDRLGREWRLNDDWQRIPWSGLFGTVDEMPEAWDSKGRPTRPLPVKLQDGGEVEPSPEEVERWRVANPRPQESWRPRWTTTGEIAERRRARGTVPLAMRKQFGDRGHEPAEE